MTARDLLTRIAELEADTERMAMSQPHQMEWIHAMLEKRLLTQAALGCCGDCQVMSWCNWCRTWRRECQSYTPQIKNLDLLSYENLLKEMSELCLS